MEPCSSPEELARDPVGHWVVVGCLLFWCHSKTLCGVAAWGRPGAAETRAMLHLFDHYRSLAPTFDVLHDVSAVEALDQEAVALVLAWLRANPEVLREHVRARVAVLPPGINGLALAGIGPALSLDAPVTLCTDATDAFRILLPDGGEALCAEVQALVHHARGTSQLVVALRGLLREAHGNVDLAAAARQLGVSTRSLQRELAAAGLSFRSEQADARFRAAETLLANAEYKLSAIAERLGLSEDGLAQLTRAKAGCTPSELRRRLGGTG